MSRPRAENVDRTEAPRRCAAGVLPLWVCLTAALAIGWTALGTPWPALAQDRLYNQPPHDLIALDEHNENKVLKVLPLNLEAMPRQRLCFRHTPLRISPRPLSSVWMIGVYGMQERGAMHISMRCRAMSWRSMSWRGP